MVYSEEDIIRLGGGEDDADVEDRPEDIKPVFAKSKAKLPNGASVDASTLLDPENATKPIPAEDPDDLSEGELSDSDWDDDYGLDDPEDRWNLRKCSAAALDVLASVFKSQVFNIILPYLEENLKNPEWPYREAAVLALGAIADGCLPDVIPHLPGLIPFLLQLLNDTEPLVRQITCWTLGRYSRWASHIQNPEDKKKYFVPMMEGILNRMLDNNKRVQEAAASAFANLEEQAEQQIIPYVDGILGQFVMAMRRYKDRNMFILYDCVQTLAENVGRELSTPERRTVLMPALEERYNKVKDDSRELFPLLECLSYVATALGAEFITYAGPIFHRCILIIRTNLALIHEATQTGMDGPDKDFLVTSLDLLSAIIQALAANSGRFVLEVNNPGFFDLLKACMIDSNNDVRQSAYALLGDCSIYVFQQLYPHLPEIMAILIDQLDLTKLGEGGYDQGISVVNNACWSCGEIAMQLKGGMDPYVDKMFPKLLDIMQTPDVQNSVTENAAIAIGRIGNGSFEQLAPHLETFAPFFIDALMKVNSTDEKDSAYIGFIKTVRQNPTTMEGCLLDFFNALGAYKYPSPELKGWIHRILHEYKSVMSDFDGFTSHMRPEYRRWIADNYQL